MAGSVSFVLSRIGIKKVKFLGNFTSRIGIKKVKFLSRIESNFFNFFFFF